MALFRGQIDQHLSFSHAGVLGIAVYKPHSGHDATVGLKQQSSTLMYVSTLLPDF